MLTPCQHCIELEAQIEILRQENARLEKDNETLLESIGRYIVSNTKALINALTWKELARKLSFKESNKQEN